MPHVTSWCPLPVTTSGVLAHCAKRGCGWAQVSPGALSCHPGVTGPCPARSGDRRALLPPPRGCPGISRTAPCDRGSQGLATPVPLTAVLTCQQQAGRKESRTGRGEKEEETRAGRGGKEEEREGEVRRLRSALRSRVAQNLPARGLRCPPQLPPALCPAAWPS